MASSSTALTKRSLDTALMPPPLPPKRIKRPPKVIDEQTYTDALTHIIARDFFPGLLESETQQDYLDALDADDDDWIKEAGDRVRQMMTPVPGGRRARRGVTMTPRRASATDGSTPKDWRGETPASLRTNATPTHGKDSQIDTQKDLEKEKVDVNMGLTAFQAKYTSEDNESFNSLLDKQNMKRAEKYSWMWNGNKMPSKRRIAQSASEERKLLQASASSTNTALILRPSEDQDTRPASIDTHSSSGPRNPFMYDPDDITDTMPQLTTRAQVAQDASMAPPRAVNYPNTRLTSWEDQAPNDDISLTPASPSVSAIDAAIRRRRPAPPSTLASASSTVSGSETPRVNGYAFVDEEPTPSELQVFAQDPPTRDDSLLMQMISSAAAENGSAVRNPFTIADSSKRETLHHRIVEKTNAGKRAAAAMTRATPVPVPVPALASNGRLAELQGSSGRTPTPRFLSSPRVGGGIPAGGVTPGRAKAAAGLTPAARILYNKVGKTPGGSTGKERAGLMGGGGAFDAAKGKANWTPTPLGIKRAG